MSFTKVLDFLLWICTMEPLPPPGVTITFFASQTFETALLGFLDMPSVSEGQDLQVGLCGSKFLPHQGFPAVGIQLILLSYTYLREFSEPILTLISYFKIQFIKDAYQSLFN